METLPRICTYDEGTDELPITDYDYVIYQPCENTAIPRGPCCIRHTCQRRDCRNSRDGRDWLCKECKAAKN